MAFGEIGIAALRAENVDKVVKGFALQKFTMKQLCTVQSSGAWQESYYKESDTELSATAKVARLAAFPQQSPIWEKSSAYHQKHGLELDVSWEDALADNIPVIARTQLRLGRAVVKSVDSLIYTTLSAGAGATVTIGETNENDRCWDSTTRSSRHPMDTIGAAMEAVWKKNYEPDTIVVAPKDYRLLMTNDDVLDAFSPTTNVAKNGNVGTLLGLNVVVSNSVTADQALVLESKTAATYRVVEDMKTNVSPVEGIKYVLRAWEIGVPFVTDPGAICKIANTNL